MTEPAQGEVWWGEAPDAKGRPFLVLTRNEAIPVLRTLVVAPITRTVRGIPTEIPLGRDEGLTVECVAAGDGMLAVPKAMLVRKLGALGNDRHHELCASLRAMADC